MVSKLLSQDSKKMKKNVHVSVTWVDWQQTLNSVVNIWVGKSILLVGVNSKMSNFAYHIWKNERKRVLQKQNRKQCNRNPWYRKRNPPGGLIIAILWCMPFISSVHELNRANCGYRVKRTERRINYSLCMDE